ncbi:MAG TPA: DUF4404 family protein [Caldimonas sp.]|nr:DUF4404 family protein [Caldimonas sp.]
MDSASRLDESLGTLRSEIRALGPDDGEARQRLEGLVADISAMQGPDGVVTGELPTGQIEALILDFEMSHPRVAVVVNEVLEKLSAMGI